MYALSPLVIIHERMAYHTAPISFFTLLLIYSLLRWVKGNIYFFPVSFLIMSLLYNLELATVVFWPVILLMVIFGIYSKQRWAKDVFKTKIIILSVLLFIIPMIPILIYDFNHGFVQTIKYAAWLVYTPLTSLVRGGSGSYNDLFFFINFHLQRLIFLPNVVLSYIVLVVSIIVMSLASISRNSGTIRIILLATIIPILAFIVGKTPSEAYLPMLTPGIMLCFAFLMYQILLRNKFFFVTFLLS